MPLRNPFAKRTGLETVDDANLNPTGAQTRPSFEKVDTVGSKSSARSIQSGRSQEPAEYKMSGMAHKRYKYLKIICGRELRNEEAWLTIHKLIVVNDSGVYLPVSLFSLTPNWD